MMFNISKMVPLTRATIAKLAGTTVQVLLVLSLSADPARASGDPKSPILTGQPKQEPWDTVNAFNYRKGDLPVGDASSLDNVTQNECNEQKSEDNEHQSEDKQIDKQPNCDEAPATKNKTSVEDPDVINKAPSSDKRSKRMQLAECIPFKHDDIITSMKETRVEKLRRFAKKFKIPNKVDKKTMKEDKEYVAEEGDIVVVRLSLPYGHFRIAAGHVRYAGKVENFKTKQTQNTKRYYGIELLKGYKFGKHGGDAGCGFQYFECDEKYGIYLTKAAILQTSATEIFAHRAVLETQIRGTPGFKKLCSNLKKHTHSDFRKNVKQFASMPRKAQWDAVMDHLVKSDRSEK